MVNPIPQNYPRVVPYLSVSNAGEAIEFYKDVFGATERVRMDGPNGTIGHAELDIGDSVVMLADVSPQSGTQTPETLGGTAVTLMIYVEDVDAVFSHALAKGAVEERKVEDQFYGDRAGQFKDPFGHKWFVASHIEDVSPEEMDRRAAQAMPSS